MERDEAWSPNKKKGGKKIPNKYQNNKSGILLLQRKRKSEQAYWDTQHARGSLYSGAPGTTAVQTGVVQYGSTSHGVENNDACSLWCGVHLSVDTHGSGQLLPSKSFEIF